MQKIKRQALKKNRLADISKVKLENVRSELAVVQEQLAVASESVDKAKQRLDSVSESTRVYLQQGNICPIRLHNFHHDLSAKNTVLQDKEQELQKLLQEKNKQVNKYANAMRINDFWQEKSQAINNNIRDLKQKALDKALNEIYLNNARVKHDR